MQEEEPAADDKLPNAGSRKILRMERAIELCIQAADTMLRIERQFDAIEK